MGKAGAVQWCKAAWIRGHEGRPGFPRQEQAQVPLTVPAGSGSLQRERAKAAGEAQRVAVPDLIVLLNSTSATQSLRGEAEQTETH